MLGCPKVAAIHGADTNADADADVDEDVDAVVANADAEAAADVDANCTLAMSAVCQEVCGKSPKNRKNKAPKEDENEKGGIPEKKDQKMASNGMGIQNGNGNVRLYRQKTWRAER